MSATAGGQGAARVSIVIVARSLPFHQIGGMEAVAWDLARTFAKKGAQVTVLTTACIRLGAAAVIDGVKIECLDARSGRYSPQWWTASRDAFERRHAGKTDIVLSVSVAAFSILPRLKKSRNPPLFVAQIHGTTWGEFVSNLRYRSLLSWLKAAKTLLLLPRELKFRSVDAQIAIGEKVEADLAKLPTKALRGPCPTIVIQNGIDEQAFAFSQAARETVRGRLALEPSGKVVVSTCRLHPQKGVDLALEGFALAAAREPALSFLIVGDGADRTRLAQRARDLQIGHKVRFVGAVGRAELRDYLSAADLFLFTTIRVEGLPLNLLEALAAGLPCIVSQQIDNPQFAATGVDPRDAQAVAAAILAAAKAAPGSRASRLPATFTLENSAERYLAAFEAMLRDRTP